jgi:hypothetical protein
LSRDRIDVAHQRLTGSKTWRLKVMVNDNTFVKVYIWPPFNSYLENIVKEIGYNMTSNSTADRWCYHIFKYLNLQAGTI